MTILHPPRNINKNIKYESSQSVFENDLKNYNNKKSAPINTVSVPLIPEGCA
jgi:hypothetical protein